jgi:hypothetical protein
MSRPQLASVDDWFDAYALVYQALPDHADVACPNCDHQTLQLVFTGDSGTGVGWASFWCDHCLYGLHLSRVSIPDGGEILPVDARIEQRRSRIPDYTIIPPD